MALGRFNLDLFVSIVLFNWVKGMKNHKTNHETTYGIIWLCLLILTVITVWVSYFNFGILNILMAILVATIKATLVGLFFMHLKYDNRTNQVVFTSSFVFLAIFSGLVASDVFYRNIPSLEKFQQAQVLKIGHEKEEKKYEDFSKSNASLIERGEELYKVHCLSCHGIRTFLGNTQEVFDVLTTGVPGTRMPSYVDLGEKERWALTHYILSLK